MLYSLLLFNYILHYSCVVAKVSVVVVEVEVVVEVVEMLVELIFGSGVGLVVVCKYSAKISLDAQ
jgi:hypothetical protein